jgi:DNA polymerase
MSLFGDVAVPVSSLPEPSALRVVPAASSATHARPLAGPVGAAEPVASLDELGLRASTCVRCGLSAARTNVVFGEGDPASPVVLVGEGPGETEDATGRPFVGKAGRLLDQALGANGIRREQVYICNVVKCRCAESMGTWLKNRPPTPAEIAACHPWLVGQLRAISPHVIVCVGGPAANTLIHSDFRITNERGKVFESSPYARFIMACLHPAYVLRQSGAAYERSYELLVSDIGAARRLAIQAKREARTAAG